jgi:serine/arginine repetitive matrix protein 2
MPGIPSELRTDTDVVASPSAEPEPSSATRRKNALARALFGASDSEQSLTSPSPEPTDGPISGFGGLASPLIESSASLRETLRPTSPTVNPSVVTSSATETSDKQRELAREVQRRTEEAMAQLMRMPSNSNPKINDGSHRKRIYPSQISGPKLVSASTSVDAIPVRSASVASGHLSAVQPQSPNSARLGTRFKKFRSLRAKPTSPSSDDSNQHTFEPASTDRSLAGTPDGPPSSAIELSRAKVAVASPSAATGPGLKGFVSRFLKPRSGETPEHDRRKHLTSSASTLESSSYFEQQKSERYHERAGSNQAIRSAPPDNKSFRPHTPVSPESPSLSNPPPLSAPSLVPDESAARALDENALKQFIDAANNLGLDQDALSEFLGRSTSVGSRLTAQGSKHMSTVSGDRSGPDKGNPALSEPAPLFGASSPGSRRSLGQPSLRPPGDVIGKAPVRRPSNRNAATSDATVVRRTLIFPSEARQSTLDPGTGLRKSSSTRRRRSASATSMHSNRSLHDRVPTPPPPKSQAARRFSAEQSPPMPHIPNSLLAQTQAISVPQPALAVPLEKSNSAYDSLRVSPAVTSTLTFLIFCFFLLDTRCTLAMGNLPHLSLQMHNRLILQVPIQAPPFKTWNQVQQLKSWN